MLKTKSIYAAPCPEDGVRILVTRWWPRGIRRSLIHEWCRDLAPSSTLLRQYKDLAVSWDVFTTSYKREIDTAMGRHAINNLRSRATSSIVTLLCYEPTGTHCHRHLLYHIILEPRLLRAAFEPEYTDHHEGSPVSGHVAHQEVPVIARIG